MVWIQQVWFQKGFPLHIDSLKENAFFWAFTEVEVKVSFSFRDGKTEAVYYALYTVLFWIFYYYYDYVIKELATILFCKHFLLFFKWIISSVCIFGTLLKFSLLKSTAFSYSISNNNRIWNILLFYHEVNKINVHLFSYNFSALCITFGNTDLTALICF